MATITRIERKSGPRYKAIIRQRGRVIKTKTFHTKAKAMLWAKRIKNLKFVQRILSFCIFPSIALSQQSIYNSVSRELLLMGDLVHLDD